MKCFRAELTELINKHSLENKSDTPDFILAIFVLECLASFDKAVNKRTKNVKLLKRIEEIDKRSIT